MRNPATNINEFVNNLLLGQLSQEEKGFYVQLYEETLSTIRDNILYDEISNQTIYLMGQVGTGKTTALNFLPNEEIKKKFEVIPLYATDLLDLNDTDIADLLAIIGYQLMKDDKALQRKYKTALERLEKLANGNLKEERTSEAGYKKEGGVEGEVGVDLNPITRFLGLLNVKFDFFANIRMDTSSRELVREVFNVSPKEIFELTNDIIQTYISKKGDKDLLLVFNELDHMKEEKLIEKIFISNRYYLDNLKCKKIISVPVVLSTDGRFQPTRECSREFIGLKMEQNPLRPNDPKSNAEIEKNRNKLKEIVTKRIAVGSNLISEEAIEKAINFSGGILRQYIDILSHAGKHARRYKSERVDVDDIEFGIEKVRQEIEAAVLGKEKVALLNDVRETHTPSQEDRSILIESLLSNQIITTFNEPTWYRLNPLIEQTVEIYAKNIEDTSS